MSVVLAVKILRKTIQYESHEEYLNHYSEMVRQGYYATYILVASSGTEVTWNMVNTTKWNDYDVCLEE